MYLTYNEYKMCGGTLEETTFNLLEFEAKTVIDYWTFNRLQKEKTYPVAVKLCMYKLISILGDKQNAMLIDGKSNDEKHHAGIAQESNDGVSTSYNVLSAKEMIDSSQKELEATVKMYLSGVRNSLGRKVLYRGVYPDE